MKYAFYYPSRADVMQDVRTRGRVTNASHDLGTASHEMRHFIDRDFLSSLEGGDQLFLELAAPLPPCQGLTGAKTDAPLHVFGMLSQPLPVRVRAARQEQEMLEDGRRTRIAKGDSFPVDLQLTNVLVVDRLPVPLHISKTSLLRCWPEGEHSGDLFTTRFDGVRLDKEAFPPSYHHHPYWCSPDVHILSTCASLPRQEFNAASATIAAQQTSDAAHRRCCECCGAAADSSKQVLRCSRCMVVRYCDKACQKAHWREHKKTCRKTTSGHQPVPTAGSLTSV